MSQDTVSNLVILFIENQVDFEDTIDEFAAVESRKVLILKSSQKNDLSFNTV